MEIQRSRQGVVHDIMIVGKLDYASSPDFDKALREVAAEKPSHLVAIDMAEVTGLSSPSLRALLSCAKRIRKDDGVLVLTRPSDVAREALTISGFLEFGLFTIEEDREAALVRLRAMADAAGLKLEEVVEEVPAAAAPAPVARSNPLLGGGGGGGAAPASASKPAAAVNPLLAGAAAAKPEAAKPATSGRPVNPLLAGGAAAKPAAAKPEAAKPAAAKPAQPNPLLAGGAAKPAVEAKRAPAASSASPAPPTEEEEAPYTLWEQIKDVFSYYLPKKK
jgi:anti-anti-sigma factor